MTPEVLPRTYDYIIVGAGSAGCVLAHRLTADPAISVLLLEAGGSDAHPYIRAPAGFLKTFQNPRFNWCYRTEPGPGVDGRSIFFPRGKVLGGSSSINGHLYVRGQARDYDTWAQLGNRGWSYDDVLPYFRRSEDRSAGADAYHGAGGPLHVSDIHERHPICEAFIAGAESIGIRATPTTTAQRRKASPITSAPSAGATATAPRPVFSASHAQSECSPRDGAHVVR